MTVEAASLPADGKLGQDRHFIGDDFVIVLDGASSSTPSDLDGGWYADILGADLFNRLLKSDSIELSCALAESIAHVADRYQLVPGNSQSSTVAVARWDSRYLHSLILGDSPLIAQTTNNTILQLRDDRLAGVATAERAAYRNALQGGRGYNEGHRRRLEHLVDVERRSRNRTGGYWIAEATPEAAKHSICARWPLADLYQAILMTDGVVRGIEQYGIPATWPDAFNLVENHGVEDLLWKIHDAESLDPDGRLWPRSKVHDDKTAVHLRLR